MRSWSRSSERSPSSSVPSFAETVSGSSLFRIPAAASRISTDRPVGDALAVGEAAAPEHVALSRRAAGDLGQQPALADPRVADDRRERGPAVGLNLRPQREQAFDFVGAADERRVAEPLVRRALLQHPDGLPDAYGLGLALGDDRLVIAVLDRV